MIVAGMGSHFKNTIGYTGRNTLIFFNPAKPSGNKL